MTSNPPARLDQSNGAANAAVGLRAILEARRGERHVIVLQNSGTLVLPSTTKPALRNRVTTAASVVATWPASTFDDSVVGKPADAPGSPKVLAGPLCESADVFTQDRAGNLDPRPLPDVAEGDIVCIHDAGAYAASMASNYNSQPFAAEVLVDGARARLVRRRQPIEDLYRLEEDSC